MILWQEVTVLVSAHAIALISPGQDLALVVSSRVNSGSKWSFISLCLGLACGPFIHALAAAFGMGNLLAGNAMLSCILQTVGGMFLFYLGIKIFGATKNDSKKKKKTQHQRTNTSFRHGMTSSILNPKAALFIYSIFASVVSVDTPTMIQVGYSVLIGVNTFIWFFICGSTLAFGLKIPGIGSKTIFLQQICAGSLWVFGSAFMFMGIKSISTL